MDMRMKLQLASPSMQYPDHAEFAAQVIRSCGDRLKGGRTLRKKQIVHTLGLSLAGRPQLFWDGESDQEIRHREEPIDLALGPLSGARATAARTRSVVATVTSVVDI